jgi:putative hydrolase of the HAD superfamily
MTAQAQMQKILKLDIHHLIDYLVSSEESGHEKPHPAPLELALIKTNLEPQNVVMIGEDEEKDIKAALNINITPIAIRFEPKDKSILFAEDFNKLHELFDL